MPKEKPDAWYTLLPREQKCVLDMDRAYLAKFGSAPELDETLVYYLGDNTSWGYTWSANSHKIPCYRCGGGKHLHRASMQYLTCFDKLTSLGWPTTPELAQAMLSTPLPCKDVSRADSVCGNGMHLQNMAVVLLLGLTCFSKVVPEMLPA